MTLAAAPADLAEGLRSLVARAVDRSVVVIDRLTALTGGVSRETWAFTAALDDGSRRDLVLQVQRGVAADAGVGAAVEAQLIRAAAAHGAPVPALLASGTGPDPVGGPFLLLEAVPGEAVPQRILRDDAFAAARPRLAGQYGAALARIQRIDPDAIDGLPAYDALAHQREILDGLGPRAANHSALELGFRWLEANRPPPSRGVVVHGDYRSGNAIVGPDGLRAVIDWELAHVGDAMEDLGWFCIRAWRWGRPLPAGGFGTYEQLFSGYEEEAGTRVDPDVVRWWEVFGCLRWAVICATQAITYVSGARRFLEFAAVGRRACEAEHDLLLLLP